MFSQCAVPEHIHNPLLQKGLEFPGDGVFWKIKKYKEMYESLLESPEEWGGVRKNLFHGRGMDIFWKYTFLYKMQYAYIDCPQPKGC